MHDPLVTEDELFTPPTRLDRELNELLQELRVVQGGVLLIVGFLLVIAFSNRFVSVTEFQKVVYYLTLIVTGLAAIVVVGPVVHHRMAFRKHDKESVIVRGNLQVLIAIGLAGLSILGILVLVTDLLFPAWVTWTMGLLTLAVVGVLWIVVPLHSIRKAQGEWRAGHPSE